MIVRVRNLRVAVVTVRDAVVIVILVLGVRLTVTIGIQLELRLNVVLAAFRVRHRHRNIELLNGVLVQLRLVRERHRDHTGVLVNLDLIALRRLEVFRNRELRTLRSLRVLTVLASERRGRLGLLARNNQLVLILRLKAVRVLVSHKDGPCGDIVSARDNNNVVNIALLGVGWDIERARRDLILSVLGLVELAGLDDLAGLIAPLNLRRQTRQFAVELRGHLGSRSSRLVGRVVIGLDRHRSVRHDRVVDVVQRVHRLAVAGLTLVLGPRSNGLVLRRDCRCAEAAARIEALEHRGVETGVAVLDHPVLVFYPHEHVVRVEDVLAGLVLTGVVTEAKGVVTVRVSLAVDRLGDVLGVVLEHLLGLFGELVRIVLVRLLQLRVRSRAVLRQRGRVHGVAISRDVSVPIHHRARGHNATVSVTSLKPHTAGDSVIGVKLAIRSWDRTFRVLNELVALGRQVAVLVARRNLTQECCRQLNVAVSRGERTKWVLNKTVEGAGHETVGLAEHLDTVATIVGERLNPDAVLLVGACRPRVFFTEFVGPGDALLARTKSKGALTAVTANNIGEGVSLRAEDRRVRAVLVTELRINGDAVHLDVAVVVRRTRVTTGRSHVHVTRDEPLTNALRVGQVRSLLDTTAGDHVSVDNLLILSGFIGHRGDARCSLSRLCSDGPIQAASGEARRHAGDQSQGQSS